MAIIYSYPKVTSPLATDVLVLTDTTIVAGKRKNKTKSIEMSDVADYVVSSTSGITGSGTLNTIAMFTPNGASIGDSGLVFTSTGGGTGANLPLYNFTGTADVSATRFLGIDFFGSTLNISTITAGSTGTVTLNGEVIIGDQATDVLQITSSVTDSTGTGSTAAGQVLASNAAGQLVWEDLSAAIIKLVPYFQLATPGGSDTYTQSNNIVDFDWSGGSGTYEYILPSATAIPYRKIRFVNNSTVSASNKIRITAPGTETIDGGAFYEINKPYNGCAVWSDGVQWIVIQAKA
jgi:hypothetical protein